MPDEPSILWCNLLKKENAELAAELKEWEKIEEKNFSSCIMCVEEKEEVCTTGRETQGNSGAGKNAKDNQSSNNCD